MFFLVERSISVTLSRFLWVRRTPVSLHEGSVTILGGRPPKMEKKHYYSAGSEDLCALLVKLIVVVIKPSHRDY